MCNDLSSFSLLLQRVHVSSPMLALTSCHNSSPSNFHSGTAFRKASKVDHFLEKLFTYLTRCAHGARAVRELPLTIGTSRCWQGARACPPALRPSLLRGFGAPLRTFADPFRETKWTLKAKLPHRWRCVERAISIVDINSYNYYHFIAEVLPKVCPGSSAPVLSCSSVLQSIPCDCGQMGCSSAFHCRRTPNPLLLQC